jgi:hypothetical protein
MPLSDIKREDVLKAFQELNQKSRRIRSNYYVVYEGKAYYPPLVISYAHKYATGQELDPKSVEMGPNTTEFNKLSELGFEIHEFDPDSVNEHHIKQAFQEIDKSGVREREKSHDFDVIYNGKKYPPKAVMRVAYRIANGIEIWARGGGPPTNDYLEDFGFEIHTKDHKMTEITNPGNYTWVQTHKELVEYLSTMENRQKELIELLNLSVLRCSMTRALPGLHLIWRKLIPLHSCVISISMAQKRD